MNTYESILSPIVPTTTEEATMNTTTYEVVYMATGEIFGTDLSYEDAQLCAHTHADVMHPEQAADIVIRKLVGSTKCNEHVVAWLTIMSKTALRWSNFWEDQEGTGAGHDLFLEHTDWEELLELEKQADWLLEEEKEPTTTGEEPMTTTTVQQEVISMDGVNKSAILSVMAAELFQNGLNPRVALIAATAWVGAADYLDDMDTFLEALFDGLSITSIDIKGVDDQPLDEINGEEIMKALEDAKYLTTTDSPCLQYSIPVMGERFAELMEMRSEAYRPAFAEDGITRRFGYAPTKYSNLFKEAIHALESSEYTVDEYMLSIARQVIAKSGGADEDKEGYVIKGCEAMSADQAYVSEFKGDRRLRMYQASCHGPNGQSSDRSRALMDLAGVTREYDIEVVLPVLKAEMADMVSVTGPARVQLVKDAVNTPVEFIMYHTAVKEDDSIPTEVSKPYSFVKAARLLVELSKGNKPYLGMASGLDAKCSGPQLGALMVGDQQIAAACGFSLVKVADAYHRAIVECEKAGFLGLTREDIKKPFMGIFYGQGWAAFMTNEDMAPAVWTSLYGEGAIFGEEDRAKAFHKAVCASFGSKMMAVRNAIKSYGEQIQGKITHYMPDGSLVAMNYKQKVNVLGEAMDYDTPKPDVFLNNNAESFKFINFQLNTTETHCGDFARNGFVNMIQATDALLARMIIVNLKRAGAQHIICVHDCFRVNMTEMHLLEEAIKLAYTDLFGGEKNERTKDLPMGKDILGLYFEGANKALMEGQSGRMVSQFFTSGKRRMFKVAGVSLMSLIKQLGTTYYFSK